MLYKDLKRVFKGVLKGSKRDLKGSKVDLGTQLALQEVVFNNLGGMGPGHLEQPKEIRFAHVAMLGGESLDLVPCSYFDTFSMPFQWIFNGF